MDYLSAAIRRSFKSFQGHLRRRGRFAVLFFSLFTLFITGLQLTFFTSLLSKPPPTAAPAPPEPLVPEAPTAREDLRLVEGSIRKGTGFADNLRRTGLDANQVAEVVTQLAPFLDFRRCQIGDRFSYALDPSGMLVNLTYQSSPLEALVLHSTPRGWKAEKTRLPSETRVQTITGRIESSLYEGLDGQVERDRLVMDFVDIFAWDIDFSHELQRGDTFRIVVEKIYREGEFITYGRILAAQYRDRDELHEAFFYPWPADGGDYYTPEGKSVRKTFLRAPVSYTRISSGYSHRRLHPIRKRIQPHLAVDYAAPVGTPVWAPADGVVISRTRDRRNGRKIVLRHPNGYETYFLHLSRFGRGMKVGRKVRQKDVIGYVGATGLATGPHLDYRMKRSGRWVNPLREKFPPGKPLPERFRVEFSRYQEWLNGEPATLPGRFAANVYRKLE